MVEFCTERLIDAKLKTGKRGLKTADWKKSINPLNAELNPIRHLLALVGARHIVHVSRVRVKEEKAHIGL